MNGYLSSRIIKICENQSGEGRSIKIGRDNDLRESSENTHHLPAKVRRCGNSLLGAWESWELMRDATPR